MKRPLLARSAPLLAGVFAAGCATILELDTYDDAVTLICQCPGFETVDECADRVSERLSEATDAERGAWLESFRAKQCGTVCDRADECYADIPGCQGKAPGCECCAWKNDGLVCTNGTCETCRTCSEFVVSSDKTSSLCISASVLLGELERCACEKCPDECTGVCQRVDPLSSNDSDPCRKCIDDACGPSLAACTADKP